VKKKGQLEFTTLVNPGTKRDEKGTPISAPSIHIGAPVGVSSLWPHLNRVFVHKWNDVIIKPRLPSKLSWVMNFGID
jgi:hypothetical protein